MRSVNKFLLAQRSDGKFLRLDRQAHTTNYDFVDAPELAERVSPFDDNDLLNPKEATYYFENSYRAKELWLKNCVMVAYEITTEITAVKLSGK